MSHNIVVIDLGSKTTCVGYAEDKLPRIREVSVLGKFRHPAVMVGFPQRDYVGREAISKRGVLTLKYPVEQGTITDFDSLEKLFKSIFYSELRVEPVGMSVVLSEQVLNPRQIQDRTKAMFHNLGIENVHLKERSTLALFSANKVSGLVLHVGATYSNCVYVKDGYVIPNTISNSNVSGRQIDYRMRLCISEMGYSTHGGSDTTMYRKIKESICYVCKDVEQEKAIVNATTFELPDGVDITLSECRYKVNELLFDEGRPPSYSLQSLISMSVSQLSEKQTCIALENIVLYGGVTRTKGICERLAIELQKLLPSRSIEVHLARNYAAWFGGKILASCLN